MKLMSKHLFTIVGGVVLINPIFAQAQNTEERAIEEVMVTATKRESSLQDTPLAISAVTSEAMRENDIVTFTDFRGVIPNFQFVVNQGHSAPLAFIRGIGTLDQTEAGDQGIAFYTDGVYNARSQGSTVLMYDMNRAEVLRGPQGTLFGRNATAGAISLHTNKPVLGEFAGSGELTVGSKNRVGTKVMLNVPLADSWALRFAGATEKRDGFTSYGAGTGFTSPSDGRVFEPVSKMGEVDAASYRVSSLWEPTDNVSWLVSYENFLDSTTPDGPSVDYDNRVNNAYAIGSNNLQSSSLRTRLDVTFANDITFSYIGGLADYSRRHILGEQYDNMQITRANDHEAMQNEFQLVSSNDNRFRWTAGLYFFHEDNLMHFDMPESDSNGWGNWADEYDQVVHTFLQPARSLDSTSGYVSGTFDITDAFRVTGGIRYTEDTREDVGGRSLECNYYPTKSEDLNSPYADSSFVPADDEEACFVRQYNDMSKTWDSTTYNIVGEWDLSDDIMLYASNATGWKSGVLADGNGWSSVAVDPGNPNSELDFTSNLRNIQDPEEVMSTEFGIKSQFGNITLNANVFLMNFSDMQVTAAVIDPVTEESTLTKTNAGEATSSGLELEATMLVGQAGTLSVMGAFLSAKYDEYDGPETAFNSEDGKIWNDCVEDDPAGGCVGGVWDFSGNSLPYAPETQLTVSYNHEFAVGGNMQLVPRIALKYTSDMYFNHANRGDIPAGSVYGPGSDAVKDVDRQPSYTRIDLGVTLRADDDQWSADLFINNATDEAIRTSGRHNSSAETDNLPAWTYEEGLSSGIRLNYNF